MIRLFVFVFLLTAPPAMGETVRVLTWEDLTPKVAPLPDPLVDQPMNVRYDLGFIAQVMADAKRGSIDPAGPEYQNAMALADRLRTTGVDVDRLTAAVAGQNAEIGRRRAQLNLHLDGQVVRIPGYALPLETSPDGVTEFLLVPYVGACIHVPPPPANQIVYAKLSSAFTLEGLYQPVWITGRIEAKEASRSLSFVDGAANVATGYTMRVSLVERYE